MPRTPAPGAILGLFSAAWLVTAAARADEASAPVPTSPSGQSSPSAPASQDGADNPTSPAAVGALPALVRFDAKTHFSLSWVRLPGAEDCVSGKKLSRAVEARLHRPALGAPSQTDVAIEGFVEKTEEGTFHAVVTINDPHGKVIGKRELENSECRDMDDSLALAIALMIDPDAAFSPTAEGAPRPRERAAEPKASPRKLPAPAFGGFVSAGIAFGFGALPETAEGAWFVGAVVPPGLFPLEVGAHLFLDQTTAPSAGLKVGFSRATLDFFVCPLDLRADIFGLGACAGVDAGTMTTSGVARDGLVQHRGALVDAAARGHLDVFFARRFALRFMPAVGIPLVRDTFDYRREDGMLTPAYRLPPVYGEASVGFGVKLP